MAEPARRPESESSQTGLSDSLGLRYVRFRPLQVALTLITILLMFVVAQHLIDRFRATQFQSQSHLAEVYIGNLLAPQLRRLDAGEQLDAADLAEVAALLNPTARRANRMALQIWGTDKKLIYGTEAAVKVELHEDDDLEKALSGQDVVALEEEAGADDGAPLPVPYLEIYLPIRKHRAGPVVAVGELYVDATPILADIRSFERTVKLTAGLATVAFLFMLAASAYQGEQLRERYEAERRLAIQNQSLRKVAETAREDASRANEETLNLVGAELHDGPVQLLSLASMMSSAPPAPDMTDGPSQSVLIRQAVDQLRGLSAGLILPEIESLDLPQVVALAADRFRALSDTPLRVTCPASDMSIDLPRRICIYRVIQEGLTNAARYGDGSEIQLIIDIRASGISISIVSAQGRTGLSTDKGPTHQLGLQGMRRRLATFGGTAVLRDVGNVAALQVELPIALDGPPGEEPEPGPRKT